MARDTGVDGVAPAFATASVSSFASNCPGLNKGLSDDIEIGRVMAPIAPAASIPNLPSNRDCDGAAWSAREVGLGSTLRPWISPEHVLSLDAEGGICVTRQSRSMTTMPLL